MKAVGSRPPGPDWNIQALLLNEQRPAQKRRATEKDTGDGMGQSQSVVKKAWFTKSLSPLNK